MRERGLSAALRAAPSLHFRMIFERDQFSTAPIRLAKAWERSCTGEGSFPLPKLKAAMVERPYFLTFYSFLGEIIMRWEK